MDTPTTSAWGKAHTDAHGNVVSWHPLSDHCLDVAIVFRQLLDLRGFRRALESAADGPLSSDQLDRLAVFALYHDFGKFNRGFQGRLQAGARRPWGHVIEAVGLFGLGETGSDALRLAEFSAWFTGGIETAYSVLLAAISHHGQPLSSNTIQLERAVERFAALWKADGAIDPLQGLHDLGDLARQAFPRAFAAAPPIDAKPALQHRFAGLLMLADWIASDEQHFPFRKSAAEDRLARAPELARAALAAIGLRSPLARSDLARRQPTFTDVFGRPPYPFQRLLAKELPVDEASQLVIAESDTGSGKTEAALAWFLHLFQAGQVDGLYFALPTRVAARELYGRVCKAIHAAFPDQATRLRPVLLAVPGYARTDDDPALLTHSDGKLWPDDNRDTLRDRAWVAENPKRFLAAPVAVGTIDQALLSVLQVRHAHLRSACLDRHLLVVDEVHASDPYMREILRTLLVHHRRVGGSALLLSATLGEAARSRYLDRAPLPLAPAQAVPYPAITTRAETRSAPRVEGRERAVRVEFLEALEHWPTVIDLLSNALLAGARVLVVMNTVTRAITLLREAEASGRIAIDSLFAVNGVCCPHHGRFARADREVLDAAVSARFGPGTPPGPLLLIGTQTLEQSLDIDADLLITDHCPMDVLLQRIGRLHRHRRDARPEGYAPARCIVLSPEGNHFQPFVKLKGQQRGEGSGPAGIGTVYEDLRILQLTRDELSATPRISIPRDNRRLVEAATHPDALARLDDHLWVIHEQFLTAKVIAECRQAELALIEEQAFGDFHFHELGGRVATRLGLNDRLANLPQPVTTPFGQTIREIAIPGHLAPHGDIVDATGLHEDADGFRFALGDKRFRYSRFGLEPITDE